MPQDEQAADLTKLSKLVAWIDEQRGQDKEVVARLSQQVDRLASEARESAAQLVNLQDGLRQNQTTIARLPLVEAALRQLRDQSVEVQRAAQEVDQRESHNASLAQAELARVTKAVGDILQQLADLRRQDDAALGRLQVLNEEVKHDRATVASLPARIEHSEKQFTSVAGRVLLVEEQLKRLDAAVGALGQSDEELKTEQKRLWQWQQSAEVRWARQLADWSQHMEDWQRLLDDHARLLQSLSKDSLQNKELLSELLRDVTANHQKLEDQSNGQNRLEGAQASLREESNRLLQGIDAQRRRIDEHAGVLRQLAESLHQQAEAAADLERRLENERGRLDDLTVSMKEREQAQSDHRGELGSLGREVHQQRYDLQDSFQRFGQELAHQQQSLRDQLDELIGVHQRHHRRQMDELEQQLRELQEQTGVAAR